MKHRIKVSDLKILVQNAIHKQSAKVTEFSVSDNPQVIKLCLRAEGTLVALQAVSDALNGDSVLLKIYAE